MKQRILIFTAIVVISVLTGGASASLIMAQPDPLEGVDTNTYKNQIVNILTDGNPPHNIDNFSIVSMTKNGVTVTATDIFYIKIDTGAVGIIFDETDHVAPYAYTVSYKLKNINYVGTYTVEYKANDVIGHAFVTTAGVNTIPEFPTIAVPVAAVLGLIFLFQSRKNKEE